MNAAPLVSVIMPVYNTSKYLHEAIQSILNQTYTHFEFIIVDDASTDNSVKIIQTFKDERIHLIVNEKNEGISRSRNKGMSFARGRYIAVFDSDDTALPYRLEKQVAFMEKTPACGLLGGQIELISETGKSTGKSVQYEEDSAKIPVILLFKNHIAQPAAMIRRSALPDVWYKPEFIIAGDYELWVRISRHHKLFNLPEKLISYRIHDKSITKRQSAKSHLLLRKILANQLNYLGVNYTEEEFEVYYTMTNYNLIIADEKFMLTYFELADRLKVLNYKKAIYDIAAFDNYLEEKKTRATDYFIEKKYLGAEKYYIGLLKCYLQLPLKLYKKKDIWITCKFAFKCLIRYKNIK